MSYEALTAHQPEIPKWCLSFAPTEKHISLFFFFPSSNYLLFFLNIKQFKAPFHNDHLGLSHFGDYPSTIPGYPLCIVSQQARPNILKVNLSVMRSREYVLLYLSNSISFTYRHLLDKPDIANV